MSTEIKPAKNEYTDNELAEKIVYLYDHTPTTPSDVTQMSPVEKSSYFDWLTLAIGLIHLALPRMLNEQKIRYEKALRAIHTAGTALHGISTPDVLSDIAKDAQGGMIAQSGAEKSEKGILIDDTQAVKRLLADILTEYFKQDLTDQKHNH